MMKLIDRYVYAVIERLPEDIRDDVSCELHTNIEDMLPENPTEDEIRAVLEKLGNPRKLAQEYNPTKRYLIGPGLYHDYISVLKLVTGIVAIVLVCITLVKFIFNPPADGDLVQYSIQFIVEILAAVIQGFVQGAVWVTLIFAISERCGINEGNIPFYKNKWTPDDLPTAPVTKKSKISRGETIFSMVCTVFFTTLVYFNPQVIAVYEIDKSGLTQVTPLFSIERLKYYMIFIIIFAFLQLSLGIWKFVSNHWSIPLASANALLNTWFCILIIVLFRDNAIINPEFTERIESYFKLSQSQNVSLWLDKTFLITLVVIIALSVWDSISAFLKCSKPTSLQDKKKKFE